MEDKYIGIIVERQDEKILLHDNTYYIKVKTSMDDIDRIIEKVLIKELDIRFYKLRTTFEEIKYYKNSTPFQAINDIKEMYLVEVCIYHEESVFLTKEEMYESLYNCPQKLFYEKYILKYEIYKQFLQNTLVSIVMIISTTIILSNTDIFNNQIVQMFLLLFIIGIGLLYKIIIPKITIRILNYVIDEKIIKHSNIYSFTIGILSIITIFILK